ncbi:c-type cytochrome [Polynucleobacter sp. MWH-UH35A]|uniref:c-type cytochrome n=1 Tax=Polynucleobacter sp. MWH-UH35A TaxID=1855619 RepID=UPI001BFED6DE|nr:c-type cytochrome [Polynucleobacter sp. MWH-UH35A]QWD60863.1 c-type cytochrome [Polynucleobacter sp. MWH-UH35A]
MNFHKLLLVILLTPILALAQVEDPSIKYDVDNLPNDHYGRLARYGKQLAEKTYAVIGPEVADKKMRYAGNNLACTNCHQEGATKKFAIPWVGAQATFPQYRGREDDVSTIEERVNGCMERSMNGKPLPFDAKEMKAFVTYIHFLSKGVPVGSSVEGQGLPKFNPPDRMSSVSAGEKVYAEKCVACHGQDGAGLRNGKPGEAKGYTFPPLWGKDTFNNGAGMNRLLTAAAFIKTNMPLGSMHSQTLLTNDEAYDVAGYILSKPRPIKANLDKDFPARWNKPVDAAFPPYVDGASAEQHKYGPFQPLIDNMKRLKPVLDKSANK